MKPILFSLLLLESSMDANEEFILRPNIQFYAKGSESRRSEEYEKFKDSELTKAHQVMFAGKTFEKMKIFYVVYPAGKDEGIIPLKADLQMTFTAKQAEFQEMKDFFSTAFPERTRRILEPNTIHGMLFQFSGEEDVHVLVPYRIDEPEFFLVKIERARDGAIARIDKVQKGAMSKNIPPRIFFDLWDKTYEARKTAEQAAPSDGDKPSN